SPVRGLIELPQDIERQYPGFFPVQRIQRFPASVQEVMPSEDVPLIGAQVRDAQPFLYLDLSPVLLPALMDLDKIPEPAFLIVPSQGKEPAEPRSVCMHRTSALRVQEGTCIPLSVHLQVRQDHA